VLQIQDLTIGYETRNSRAVVARDIDLTLDEGEMVCLLGPNGAGKSTLMRTVAGMQPALGGRVLVDGEDIHVMPARERAKRLSVVLTERVSAGLLTAQALVELGRYPHTNWSGKLTEADRGVVRWAIEQVGAEELAHRHVSDLSDGERQRVMMARALAQEPRMMILDEITAFLDLPRRVEVMRLLRRLARETHRAILLSTHDLELALRTADRIWLLSKDGALDAGGPEDLVLSGAFEAAFAGEGVDFDQELGSFRVHKHFVGEVELVGAGLRRAWTVRALEREGVRVWQGAGSHPGVRVLVGAESGEPWELQAAAEQLRFGSLYHLAQELKRRFLAVTDAQP